MRLIRLLTAAGVGACVLQPAQAEPMRCGTHLVDVGASVYELRKHCGEPSYRQGGEWIYDRGPGRLTMVVRIAEGEVQSIGPEGEDDP